MSFNIPSVVKVMRTKIGKLMGDSHINRIILLLYFGGRKSKTEIYRHISTNPRMPKKIEFLQNEGYITISLEGTREHPRNMVDLTPLGNSLAEGLCELETSIGGDVDAIRSSLTGSGSEGFLEL